MILGEPQNGLPADTYGFFEMYCDEPGCDCRRVFFMVVSERLRETLAIVAYGWKSREFYARWMGSDDPDDVDDLQGPILNFGSPQSKLSSGKISLVLSTVQAYFGRETRIMPYEVFHNFYPDLAERETRTLILPEPRGGLPADAYTMLEMYCNEPRCDCRRVFFMVVGQRHREPLATIAYGWESREYYARWMGSDAPEDIEELQGPILNLASPQSKYARALLHLVENVLLTTPAYIERLKRHYQLVRDLVDRRAPRTSGHAPRVYDGGGQRIPSASGPVIDRRLDAAERKRVLAAKMRELHERRSQKKRAR